MYKVIRAVIKIGCSSELRATRKFFDDKFEIIKNIEERERETQDLSRNLHLKNYQ